MTHDLIVIGAGPAGISAALTASSIGLRTLLLEEQARPGGQIYRNVTNAGPRLVELLGPDYTHGRPLVERLGTSGVDFRPGSLVWDVTPGFTVTGVHEGCSFQAVAPQLIAATGTTERPSPLPGWTLPGVFNAGAAQIMLKAGGSIPSGRIILVGGGPLLLLVACQLLDAGASVAGLVETSPGRNRLAALPYLAGALRAPSYLAKGLRLQRRLRAAKVPWFTRAEAVSIEGDDRARAICFTVRGKTHRLEADTVLLHHGVVPNTQITRLLRVEHHWDDIQLAWCPRTDAWGETSLAGFRIAGDGARISGALAAEASGTLAAIGAAYAESHLSREDSDCLAVPARKSARREAHIRPFLDALYRPPQWVNTPSDETIVCRCEEVTAGTIRQMARLGCLGPNQTKTMSRCGMGPCQGRLCGLVVTQLLAQAHDKSPAEIGAYRIRAPLKPVLLSSISKLTRPIMTENVP